MLNPFPNFRVFTNVDMSDSEQYGSMLLGGATCPPPVPLDLSTDHAPVLQRKTSSTGPSIMSYISGCVAGMG